MIDEAELSKPYRQLYTTSQQATARVNQKSAKKKNQKKCQSVSKNVEALKRKKHCLRDAVKENKRQKADLMYENASEKKCAMA